MEEYNQRRGLTTSQVEKRIEAGQVNFDTTAKTKSAKQIILGNLFTPFNLLNFCLAILILCVHSYKNLLFLGVVFCNCIIGMIQELRSKYVVDKLSLLAATGVIVKREGKEQTIAISEIVLDDLVRWRLGNQVVVDSVVLGGSVEVNEAFLTGESDPVLKRPGDHLLSGSFIVSGSCTAQVEHVGLDNYTAKISHDAKKLKRKKSEIMGTINRIVKLISIIILPLGILLFLRQYSIDQDLARAVVHTVAALIVMIPEGLVLLTSVVFAVSVLRLSKYEVLVQQLYCIETLARVDVLCLDKTGTLTEGRMEVADLIPIRELPKQRLETLVATFGHYSQDENATIEAVRSKYEKYLEKTLVDHIAFSSDKKYSALQFEDGTYILGAPEFVLETCDAKLEAQVQKLSDEYRVIGFFSSNEPLTNQKIPKNPKLLCLLLIKDVVRMSAKETLAYFKEQGVQLKVISGDSKTTVSQIAKILELDGATKAIDLSKVAEEDYPKLVEEYTIFGRVTPEQKKKLILALKGNQHVVAMTGDGVNDILALKEADCSIAMASGSDGARNVSDLVLLNSDFDSLPKVVAEGRRSINNVERSSSLFLSKTIYATFIAIFFLFVQLPYPFIPIQLSLISVATIGIPSFALALEPNTERIRGKFFENVLRHSLPAAFTVFTHIVLLSVLSSFQLFTSPQISSMTVLLTAYVGFLLIDKLSRPFNWYRRTILISMILLFLSQFLFMKDLFSISDFTWVIVGVVALCFVLDTILYRSMNQLVEWLLDHSQILHKILYGRKKNFADKK